MQAHIAHQPLNRATGHLPPLALQLTPDLACAVDTLVGIPSFLNGLSHIDIAPLSCGQALRPGLSEFSLVTSFAQIFVGISTAETLPIWSFISGGIVNLLAPSGGGQWAVQGPVMVEAAKSLGASQPATALAVQIGDQWANMIQPFWLLPVLAISGLKLRDVMGYMVLVLLYLGVIFSATILLWGFLSI